MSSNQNNEQFNKTYETHWVPADPGQGIAWIRHLKAVGKRWRRWSPRPQKHLLFTWLHHVFRQSHSYKHCIDVACGDMLFYPYIKTEKYTGIDMDKERLEHGVKLHPNAQKVLSYIEDIDPDKNKGDFVMCIETIGVNFYFEPEKTVLTVKKLMACTEAGGLLMFNTGPRALPYSEEVTALLQENFRSVSVKKYGSFNGKQNKLISALMAMVMHMIPPLRTITLSDRRLDICKGKNAA